MNIHVMMCFKDIFEIINSLIRETLRLHRTGNWYQRVRDRNLPAGIHQRDTIMYDGRLNYHAISKRSLDVRCQKYTIEGGSMVSNDRKRSASRKMRG